MGVKKVDSTQKLSDSERVALLENKVAELEKQAELLSEIVIKPYNRHLDAKRKRDEELYDGIPWKDLSPEKKKKITDARFQKQLSDWVEAMWKDR